ncbi:MAG: permease [Gemmatimonadetes bacterium]|nr:permease [Gemmatimonadota bacterium]
MVVLSLALAIALNTTMYSMLDAMLHPRLDMVRPEEIWWVKMFGDYRWKVDDASRARAVSEGLRSAYASTTYLSGFGTRQLVEFGSVTREADEALVSPNYFDFIGARPRFGRLFLPSDSLSEIAVVIRESMARELFLDPSKAVGQTVLLNKEPHVIIGVVSDYAKFPGERPPDVWMLGRGIYPRAMFVRLVRLKPGVTRQQAESELAAVATHLDQDGGYAPGEIAFRFIAAAKPQFQLKGFHQAMIFSVFSVLLVACANLANIQLARGIGRRRELALRSALGATRGRLVKLLLLESALLGAAGLALGLVLTYWGAHALRASIPKAIGEMIVEPQWSWRVLLAALGATSLCIVLIGLLPALTVSRLDPAELIKSGHGTGATHRNRRRYGILVAFEIGLALALLSSATVTVRSALIVSGIGMGFDPKPIAIGYINYHGDSGRKVATGAVLQMLADRLAHVDGVSQGTVSTYKGLQEGTLTYTDGTGTHEYEQRSYGVNVVTSSYMKVFGYPILMGRDFAAGEQDEGLIIVDKPTAQELWGSANPVGQQVKLGAGRTNAPYLRVIGVVGEDPRFNSQGFSPQAGRSRRLGGIYYLPSQKDSSTYGKGSIGFRFTARAASGDATRLPVDIRNGMRGSGDVRVQYVQTADNYFGYSSARASLRFVAWLFSLFGVMGVGLAAFGVYGVVAHSVAERRREMGVRLALGADAAHILHAILRESVVVALGGIAFGLMASKYGVQLLDAFAWPGDLYNPLIFAATGLAMLATVLLSAWVPARRATRIDPAESLRSE